MTRRGWLLFLALSVIWGIPYLLLPAVMKRGDLRMLLPRWRPILLFTLVEVALPWWLPSDAERRISSSLSGLLVASVPLAGGFSPG